MFYLVLATLSSALVALVLKFSEKKTSGTYGVCVFNYITCFITGFLFIPDKNLLDSNPSTVALGALSGLLYLGSLVLYQVSILKNGTVLAAVFSKLGVIIPVLLSFLLFGESPTLMQVIGILLSVFAILVINFRRENSDSPTAANRNSKSAAFGLILLLVIGGLCNSMAKVFEFFGERKDDDKFMFFNFFFAFLYALLLLLKKRERITKYDLIFGFLLGIPNYFSTRFLLKALLSVPSFIAYPTYSVGGIIVICALGRVLFGEKLTKQQLAGVGITLVALVLMNI